MNNDNFIMIEDEQLTLEKLREIGFSLSQMTRDHAFQFHLYLCERHVHQLRPELCANGLRFQMGNAPVSEWRSLFDFRIVNHKMASLPNWSIVYVTHN